MTIQSLVEYLRWFPDEAEVLIDVGETRLRTVARADNSTKPVIVMGKPIRTQP